MQGIHAPVLLLPCAPCGLRLRGWVNNYIRMPHTVVPPIWDRQQRGLQWSIDPTLRLVDNSVTWREIDAIMSFLGVLDVAGLSGCTQCRASGAGAWALSVAGAVNDETMPQARSWRRQSRLMHLAALCRYEWRPGGTQ